MSNESESVVSSSNSCSLNLSLAFGAQGPCGRGMRVPEVQGACGRGNRMPEIQGACGRENRALEVQGTYGRAIQAPEAARKRLQTNRRLPKTRPKTMVEMGEKIWEPHEGNDKNNRKN